MFCKSDDDFAMNDGIEVPTTWATGQRHSVHRVVLGYDPRPILVLGCDREQFLIGAGLACMVQALAAVVKDGQGWCALPLCQFPGKQRMLRLGIADEVRILLAV